MTLVAAVACPRLTELEEVITRGQKSFIEVGQALLEIRDSRLYRLSFSTFEDYCRERWGWSHQRVSQLVIGSEVATIVATSSSSLPQNESQARELAKLRDEPDVMREVWQEAVDRAGGQPTTLEIHEVREERAPSFRTRAATAERRDTIERLGREGHRVEAIADRVGVGPEAVRKVLTLRGVRTVTQTIGKAHNIDMVQAVDTLVTDCLPPQNLLDAIYAEWDQLDKTRMSAWAEGLSAAISSLTTLRNRLRKDAAE